MPTFALGQTITSTTPFMPVSPGLGAGTYTWRLEVIDTAGNISSPSHATVKIYSTVSKYPIEPEPLPPPPKPEPETM